MTAPKETVIKSAARVLTLLEYLRQHRSATVGEVANSLGWPQSSASGLLRSLFTLGYLEYFSETRRFAPTYRVALLGESVERSMFGSGPLTAIMQELQIATGETALLGMQIGPLLQYIHVLRATYPLQLTVSVGQTRPMAYTAMGRILLSELPNAKIRAIVRHNNANTMFAGPRVSENAFLRELEEAKARGYAESRGIMTAGANTIAINVGSCGGTKPLALGVGGPIDRIAEKRERVIAALALARKRTASIVRATST